MTLRSGIVNMKSLTSAAVFSKGNNITKKKYKYQHLSKSEDEDEERETRAIDEVDIETHAVLERHLRNFQSHNNRRVVTVLLSVSGILMFLYLATAGYGKNSIESCDTVKHGFKCRPTISRYWGQYSPYFEVPSEIPNDVPEGCQITFSQILSRHGARDPTLGKTIRYAELIARIHTKAISYSKDFAFIKSYNYSLGADQLSVFGQQQMVNSGEKYYQRYKNLTRCTTPFIRASGQARVIESAQNWTQGFHSARSQDQESRARDDYPYSILIIPESSSSNNTLDHSLCTAFENGPSSAFGQDAQKEWLNIFAPSIATRLNENLPGVDLSDDDIISLMDLCPFSTVASPLGLVSKFCSIFSEEDWKDYDYYQSLGKYYGYSWGNPLGATQGIGFANELISRLTNTPVDDHTNTNSTLDSNPETFPLGGKTTLYADFSHDNDMTSIFAALGLYNKTRPLLNTTREDYNGTAGYSAAWTVPFAGRAYFEKLNCVGNEEELVRVVVNDRVLPLESCGGDELGRCGLGKFVESLSFPREGGEWDKCFA